MSSDAALSEVHALGPLAWAAIVSVALRITYLRHPALIDVTEVPVFIADEGVVGLMAHHILQGAHPIFFYGQFYLGTLQSYLAAALFTVAGESMTTLRLVPTLWAVSWIPLAGLVAHRLFGMRAAFLAAAFAAIPSPFVFEWGLKARLAYAEGVAFLLAALWLVLLILAKPTWFRLAALGFLLGVSLWVNQLLLAYVPVLLGALLLWQRLSGREWTALAGAAMLGGAPMLYANIVDPLCTVRALATEARSSMLVSQRRALDVDSTKDDAFRAVPLLMVVGAQPKRDGEWSAAGTAAAVVLIAGAVLGVVASLRQPRTAWERAGVVLLVGYVVATFVVGISGLRSGQPVGRYQIVLYPLLGILFAGLISRRRRPWGEVAVAALLVVNATQLAAADGSGAPTPPSEVVAMLRDKGLTRGFSAGFMEDIEFISGEEIVLAPVERPRVPGRDAQVLGAERLFYVFRDDQVAKPAHRAFVDYLRESGIEYQSFRLGEYTVFADLTPVDRLRGDALAQVRTRIRERKGR